MSIELIGLSKTYGDFIAVHPLDLSISPGEIFGFLGPNGAGKTTTVKLITGVLKPTSGTVRVAGFDIGSQTIEAKRHMGLVPDEPFVYLKLTAVEYLQFIGELYGVSLEAQKKRIPELLELFELSPWGGELLESFSHGMRQKLVLSGIMLHDPKVLVLDEPMVGLDPQSARVVKDIFQTLSKRGTTIFMCTHVLEIAEKLCHRIGIMQGGKLIALGTIAELRQQAKSSELGLEDIFLSLTGGHETSAILKHI